MRDSTVTGPYYGAHIAIYTDMVLTPSDKVPRPWGFPGRSCGGDT